LPSSFKWSSGEPTFPSIPPLRTVRESFQLTRLKPKQTPFDSARQLQNGDECARPDS